MLLFFIALLSFIIPLNASYTCSYTCSTDPLNQLYANQNMCVLMDEVPATLKNLSYAVYSNCDVYDTYRFGYNKRFNWFPNVIFAPTNNIEIQHVLKELVRNKLPFYIRSGGHCYEPMLYKGYIIDLRNFNVIIPDKSTGTVRIGAGCKLGDVISALSFIDYAIPTGTCPSVGISGLALGGGIGYLIRNYGLTCDSIVEMTVLKADGNIITVSENSHPDLFWALRGAGANSFGIVLEYKFKMYHVPSVSFLQLRWDWDPEMFFLVYKTWQSWVMTLPKTISSETVFKYKEGRIRLSVNALKVGSESFTEWEDAFKKFNPTSVVLHEGNYIDAAKLFASNYPMPYSKTKSKILFRPLPQAGISVLINWMQTLLNNQCAYEAFFGIGAGILGAIPETDTAYFPRKAYGWMLGFIYWNNQSQEIAAVNTINQVYKNIEPYTSPYSYSNLVDYDIGPNYLHKYYGNHVSRLIKIKNEYDPQNVFSWRQGIPLEYKPKSIFTEYLQNKYCTTN